MIKLNRQVELNDFIELKSGFKKESETHRIGIFGYPEINYKKTKLTSNNESVFQSGMAMSNRIKEIN